MTHKAKKAWLEAQIKWLDDTMHTRFDEDYQARSVAYSMAKELEKAWLECEQLKEQNLRFSAALESMRSALEFYAEPETYEAKYPPTGFTAWIDEDEGKRARLALQDAAKLSENNQKVLEE